ncbi:unnamed protein product [Protopolystoma xenopodis]|uniref:Immunoglobulin I-set domain-containing protein n=1 Tax=Protopolystoma xenopodis TaxID=117903 RepID=A0A448WDQ5_9PLAT|nr:unnamed protein product [Protopolystoma xenopodis]
MFEGELVKPSSYCQIDMQPEGLSRLTLVSAYPEEAGVYSLLATNPIGQVAAQARVTVLSRAEQQHPPRFIIPLPSEGVRSDEGSPFAIEVEVEGIPMPTVTWLQDDRPLAEKAGWEPLGNCFFFCRLTTIWPYLMSATWDRAGYHQFNQWVDIINQYILNVGADAVFNNCIIDILNISLMQFPPGRTLEKALRMRQFT